MFVIRRADTSDKLVAAAVATLHDECFETGQWLGKSEPDGTGCWWIAFAKKEAAGYAELRPSITTPNAGYMARSGVLPKFRGHGLQKRLIKKRIEKARELGWDTLITDTYDNPASANSLIACGFRVYHPDKPWGVEADGPTYWRYML